MFQLELICMKVWKINRIAVVITIQLEEDINIIVAEIFGSFTTTNVDLVVALEGVSKQQCHHWSRAWNSPIQPPPSKRFIAFLTEHWKTNKRIKVFADVNNLHEQTNQYSKKMACHLTRSDRNKAQEYEYKSPATSDKWYQPHRLTWAVCNLLILTVNNT